MEVLPAPLTPAQEARGLSIQKNMTKSERMRLLGAEKRAKAAANKDHELLKQIRSGSLVPVKDRATSSTGQNIVSTMNAVQVAIARASTRGIDVWERLDRILAEIGTDEKFTNGRFPTHLDFYNWLCKRFDRPDLVSSNYPANAPNFVRDYPVSDMNVVVNMPVDIQGGKQAAQNGPSCRGCPANPGRAKLFEFACHPQSMIGTVAENLGVDIHRFSLDVCDLTTKEGRTYALGVARSNPGVSMHGSLPCTPWSTWNFVNSKTLGHSFRMKLLASRTKSLLMLRNFAVVARRL